MPTYFVNTSNIKFKKNIKEKLAKKITKIHNEATGANKYFAQVVFNNSKRGDHYMGGKMVSKPEIFIYGHIYKDIKKYRYPSINKYIYIYKAPSLLDLFDLPDLWLKNQTNN